MRPTTTIPRVHLPLLAAVIFLVSTALAEDHTPQASPVDINATSVSKEQSIYGPILSKDPATRILIKNLYLEKNLLGQETLIRLQELNRAYVAETDADFRWQLSTEMGEIKRNHEIRNMEIGLEIANLNGQEQRAADYALALDQIQNPENYLPENRPDPALKAARLRKHDQK